MILGRLDLFLANPWESPKAGCMILGVVNMAGDQAVDTWTPPGMAGKTG